MLLWPCAFEQSKSWTFNYDCATDCKTSEFIVSPRELPDRGKRAFLENGIHINAYQKPSGFEGTQVFMLIDSTNVILGVCVILFLPYDWLESNNSFPHELKERIINCHFPKHVLSFSWVCWPNWFLSSSSWDMQSPQNVALHFVLKPLNLSSDC